MQLFVNNIETTLSASLTSTATTMYVSTATGMPEPTGDDYFLLTLCKRDSSGVESSIEIVKCTARSSNNLTIVRAQESTSGIAYDAGDIVSLRLTAGSLNDNIMQADGLPLAIGRINNPLLHLPLKNSTDMICGTGTVIFTRTQADPQSVSYIDRYGVVQYVDQNEARFEEEGLLIEGESTNLLTYSEDFDNSAWAKNASSIGGSTTGPDGNTITANGLIASTDDVSSHYIRQIGVAATPTKDYSLSVFAKKGDKNWLLLKLRFYDSTPTLLTENTAYFDLDNCAVGTVSSGATSSIKELSNGWVRCTITATADATAATSWNIICVAEGNNDSTFAGDGSTINIYTWGAQLEEMPFASSYIPTTTAAVTRAGDSLYVTYNENIPAPNTEEMSVLCDIDILGLDTIHGKPWRVEGETLRQLQVRTDTFVPKFFYGSNSADSNAMVAGSSERVGCVYDKTSGYIYLDGELLDSLVVTTIAGSATSISIAAYWYGHISNFRIYDVALSSQEMRIA